MNYDELPHELQDYLASRFELYGLDPELAYDYLLPVEIKTQGWEAIENFMRHKHISHIYPQSVFPEMSGDLDNVFLEDPSENLIRGNKVAGTDEVLRAESDNITDSLDGDFNDDGTYDRYDFLAGY